MTPPTEDVRGAPDPGRDMSPEAAEAVKAGVAMSEVLDLSERLRRIESRVVILEGVIDVLGGQIAALERGGTP